MPTHSLSLKMRLDGIKIWLLPSPRAVLRSETVKPSWIRSWKEY